MKRFIRILARLYPAPWRARYGAEFDQLIEDSKPGWHDVANVVTGAMKMQFTQPGYWRTAAAGMLLGVAASAAIAYSIPMRLGAEVQIIAGNSDPESLDAMQRAEQMMLSRESLLRLIEVHDLYHGNRNRQPTDVTVQELRDHITFTPTRVPNMFVISFEYPDREKAQSVVDSLVRTLSFLPLPILRISPIERPRFPIPPYYQRRPVIIGSGLLAGPLAGLMFAWLRRRQYATMCPTCGHRTPAPLGELQGA